MYDLLITGGTLVLPSGPVVADLAVQNEKIVALGALAGQPADLVLRADGKLLLPGLVDPHVHLADEEADKAASAVDDFYTGTVAAAMGGTTTVVDFAPCAPSQSAVETIQARRARADGQVAVDYALHAIVEDGGAPARATQRQLPNLGVTSIKAFMFRPRMDDDFALQQVMQTAAAAGLVMMVHAENGALLRGHLHAQMDAGQLAVQHYPLSQPPIAEIEAAQRAILLAEQTGATLYIVHISTAATVNLVRAAQARGLPVIGETVPHNLLLTEAVYAQRNGTDYLCGPPVRTAEDHAGLWRGLADGTLAAVGSDHCGFSASQKAAGLHDFRLSPKGMASIETRGVVMYSEGVAQGRLSLTCFVKLMAENPARIFGLYPQKGVLALGSDADLCVWDPAVEWTITPDHLHCAWGYNPHQGLRVTGKPSATILRGQVIMADQAFSGQRGYGRYLPRTPGASRFIT